jgi:hypothetical protein
MQNVKHSQTQEAGRKYKLYYYEKGATSSTSEDKGNLEPVVVKRSAKMFILLSLNPINRI